MTVVDFEAFVARWDLVAPVTMEDLAHIHAELKQIQPVGLMSELVLRGDRVEVVLGCGGPAPCTRWIPVQGGTPDPSPGLASALARSR